MKDYSQIYKEDKIVFIMSDKLQEKYYIASATIFLPLGSNYFSSFKINMIESMIINKGYTKRISRG